MHEGTEVELLALDPDLEAPGEDRFHGYAVLGRATSLDVTDISQLLAQGIADSDGTRARCFLPRHGFRFISGEVSSELLLCLECSALKRVYGGEPEEWTFDAGVADALNEHFSRAGLEIHP